MLYLNLNDSEVEVLEVEKTIFGEEKIVSCARKEIPEGIVINGLIVDESKFISEIQSIFSSGYPKSINGKEVTLSISDKQVFIERFSFPPSLSGREVEERIVTEAKKTLPYDPAELINLFKTISGERDGISQVLYTALLKHTLVHFGRVMKGMSLKLVFLSSKSLAIFELIKYLIGENEKILYISCNKNNIEYYFLDKFGPIATLLKKTTPKHFEKETKEIIENFEKEKNVNLSKIIVGGIESINLETVAASENLGRQVIKLQQVLGNLTATLKIKIDTGGVPDILFADTLGLFLLSRIKLSPNFATDLDKMDLSFDFKSDLEKAKNEQKIIPSKKEEEEILPFSGQLPVVEYKESLLGNLFSHKWLVGLFVVMIVSWIVLSIVAVFRGNARFPFITSPTITPSPTIMPTLTPIPTLDPTLKRGDLKLSVQNGTSKTGYAKEISSFLEGLGYKNVAKANADKDTYEKTVTKIKTDKKKYFPLIVDDLKDKVDTSTVEDLEEKDSFDIVIILGLK